MFEQALTRVIKATIAGLAQFLRNDDVSTADRMMLVKVLALLTVGPWIIGTVVILWAPVRMLMTAFR